MDGEPPDRKRVRAACDRCRRQKLKCDNTRPCALCLRTGVECVGDPERMRKRRAGSGTVIQAKHRLNHSQHDFQVPINHNSEDDLPNEGHHIVATAAGDSWRSGENTPQGKPPDTSTSKLYSQGISAVELTREILQQFESGLPISTETSALPGGRKAGDHSARSSSDDVPLSVLLCMELPSATVCDFLVDTYFDSVHWFMLVLHEPSFRRRYKELIQSGRVSQSDMRFIALVMLVLGMGARYVSPEAALQYTAGVDLAALQSSLLEKVREHIFDIFDEGAIESVQICILLSSFYLYHGRPNLAFIILGSGVKSAQAMGLHQESTWKASSLVAREIKRRVWWAIYVFDRFASIVFGRPCSILESDCHVRMPINMDDTSARHPVHASLETLENGSVSHVTIFSYQRFKFKLYKLASAVIGDIYTHRSRSTTETVEKVKAIHEQLLAWFQNLPPELQHNRETSSPDTISDIDSSSSVTRTFELQALALQLAYDNLQILLHRPLLSYNLKRSINTPEYTNNSGDRPSSSPRTYVQGGMINSQPLSAALALSKRQCWESAIRTSLLSDRSRILKSAQYTHAATYIGINLFTAGMILSIVALSKPLSSQSQESKRAIARVVQMSASLGQSSILSAQSGKILQDLVRLILEKEMASIFKKEVPQNGGDEPATVHELSRASETSRPATRFDDQNPIEINLDHGDHVESMQEFGLNEHRLGQRANNPLCEQTSDAFDESNLIYSPAIDFNEGISFIQQVIRTHANPSGVTNSYTEKEPDAVDRSPMPLDDSVRPPGIIPDGISEHLVGLGGLQDMQQAWLWDLEQDHLSSMSFGGTPR